MQCSSTEDTPSAPPPRSVIINAWGRLKPSDLAGLQGDSLIIFDVDPDDPTKNFYEVLDRIVVACTGKETPHAPQNIHEIPVTTADKGVYVIEMRGKFEWYVFNKERLMGVKGTNYLTAIQIKEEWEELGTHDKESEEKKLIEGSKLMGFKGSYSEFSSSGLQDGNMKLGFGTLMRSMIELFTKKKKPKSHFLTVCVNLFEPPRFPFLRHMIIQYPFGYSFLSQNLGKLLNLWKKLSKPVIGCQKDKKKTFVFKIPEICVEVYSDDGELQQETFTEITNENAHKLLGMVKCNTTAGDDDGDEAY